MAASTDSSLMPCSRRRSTILARVRADVIPMPSNFSLPAITRATVHRSRRQYELEVTGSESWRCADSSCEPFGDARHFRVMGEIHLQRRQRHVALGHRMEVGTLPRVGRLAGGADPVACLSARRRGLDDRLGLVSLAEARDAHAGYVFSRN